MAIYIMDACSLSAYLRGEQGDDVVENILLENESQSLVHAVNLCEVYYDTLRSADLATAQQAIQKVYAVGVQLRTNLDPAFWQLVGELKVNPGKMSLADCFALALAITTGGTLVTSDHEFDPVVPLGLCPILFIR